MASTARGSDPSAEEAFLGALYRGGELLAAGKMVEAREHLEKAHQLEPKNEKAQNLLGLTYFKLGLFDDAARVYGLLVRANPTDPTLRVNLGLVYLKTNSLQRCIDELEAATKLDPAHQKAHNYLGLALAQAGEYERAGTHFRAAGSEVMAERMAKAVAARGDVAPRASAPPEPPPTAPAPPPPPEAPAAEVMTEAVSPTEAFAVTEEAPSAAPASGWDSAPATPPAEEEEIRFAEDEGPSSSTLSPTPHEAPAAPEAPARTTDAAPAWLTMEAAEATEAPAADETQWVTDGLGEMPMEEAPPGAGGDPAWAQTSQQTAEAHGWSEAPAWEQEAYAETAYVAQYASGSLEAAVSSAAEYGGEAGYDAPAEAMAGWDAGAAAAGFEMQEPDAFDTASTDAVAGQAESEVQIDVSVSSATPPPVAPPAGYGAMPSQRLMDLGASSGWAQEPGAGPFHMSSDGLAVVVNGEMRSRMTGLVAVVGGLEVTPEVRRKRGRPTSEPFGADSAQLQRLSGAGTLFLEPGRHRFFAVDLTDNDGTVVDDDGAYLREAVVFAFEESVSFENGGISGDGLAVELVHLKGQGKALLQLEGAMKSMPLQPGAPMVVPLKRLVGWFGRATPRLLRFGGQDAIELRGEGYALLETPGERA
jgi:tetratricopeptide (TPR) repeat protein/uncharacterized protein (AIM24 family)